MKLGYYADVEESAPAMAGAQATTRWLIAEKDGAKNFAMRVIEIKHKGEQIPLHLHDFEHEVFVISGTGRAFTSDFSADMKFGDYVFVAPGQEHGFENTGHEPFRFICVIPIRH